MASRITDASYFRVSGWGYYYLVTVMDDYSRFILAHMLQRDMTSDSLIEVVQEAVDVTGMTDVAIEDRTKLLSDNGSGYVSRAFRDYLQLVGIRHILAAPYHPQTNGKLERYHQTTKRDVNLLVYEVPNELGQEIIRFVEYATTRRWATSRRSTCSQGEERWCSSTEGRCRCAHWNEENDITNRAGKSRVPLNQTERRRH